MVKLTEDRIALICREAARGWVHHRPVNLARLWGVSTRRIRQIAQQHRETGEMPQLKHERRPKAPPLTSGEKTILDQARLETQRGATKIHKHLAAQGIHIPKHKIHAYARAQKWTTPNPRKQRKRSRCRYEREHTGSLIHGDWHRTSLEHPHAIIWLDDASRMVVFAGEYDSENGENSRQSLLEAFEKSREWGLPIEQVHTDRGGVFYANKQKGKEVGDSEFTKLVSELGSQHIVSRPNNPQTNGKLERLWLEYDRHRWRFETIGEWAAWNNRQIHGALWEEVFETPEMAWQRKLPQEVKLGLHLRLVEARIEVSA